MLKDDIKLIDAKVYDILKNEAIWNAWERIKMELKEGQKPTTNSDYAAALRTVDNFAKNGDGIVTLSAYVNFCKQRLNSSTNCA